MTSATIFSNHMKRTTASVMKRANRMERFLQQNLTLRIYPLLRDVRANLKSHNYKINPDLIDVFNAHGYDATGLAERLKPKRKATKTKR
jgi:hypothetical protein